MKCEPDFGPETGRARVGQLCGRALADETRADERRAAEAGRELAEARARLAESVETVAGLRRCADDLMALGEADRARRRREEAECRAAVERANGKARELRSEAARLRAVVDDDRAETRRAAEQLDGLHADNARLEDELEAREAAANAYRARAAELGGRIDAELSRRSVAADCAGNGRGGAPVVSDG